MSIKTNKLLGQHFLTSEEVARKIVDAAEITKDDTILEVGPGEGFLTRFLIEKAKNVIAIEKDERLVEHLHKTFKNIENLEIVHGDILKPITYNLKPAYKLIANIPYYLTSRLFRLFLEDVPRKPERIVVMIQKEVAERIVARPPEMSLLALSIQAYGTPQLLFRVPKTVFSPQPDVDSAVISITNISNAFFEQHNIEPKKFFAPIKKAFSQKRKMLRNSLGLPSDHPSAKKRPQDLDLGEWVTLTSL